MFRIIKNRGALSGVVSSMRQICQTGNTVHVRGKVKSGMATLWVSIGANQGKKRLYRCPAHLDTFKLQDHFSSLSSVQGEQRLPPGGWLLQIQALTSHVASSAGQYAEASLGCAGPIGQPASDGNAWWELDSCTISAEQSAGPIEPIYPARHGTASSMQLVGLSVAPQTPLGCRFNHEGHKLI